MKNTTSNAEYVTFHIPKALADEIDGILQSGVLGYRSRAELVADAVRRRIEELSSNDSRGQNNFKLNSKNKLLSKSTRTKL
jgi:metal-responsive CopG/Arc/MetJ family transcriptional regulator